MPAPKYKIGYVLDDSLDSTDGVQQYILNVGKWMADRGHEVHYIVGQTKRRDVPHIHSLSRNISVSFNGNRMSIPLPVNMTRVKTLLAREHFDILHIQTPYSPFMGGKLVLAADPKTAVVGTFHIAPNSKLVSIANNWLRLLCWRSLPRFDRMISVSAIARNFAKETFRLSSVVIPNTIELQPFRQAKPLPASVETVNIIFLGRLVQRKGCQYFLKAISNLHSRSLLAPNVRVIICGKGPMEPMLKDYVAEHGLYDLVTFTGFVSEEDKPNYLSAADILVYPSTGGESFGIVLLEGMAASRGVVLAGDNPGYRSVLHERTKALFNPKDEQAFASLLLNYLQDPAKRQEAAIWQRDFVGQYDTHAIGSKIEAVYTEALRKRVSS